MTLVSLHGRAEQVPVHGSTTTTSFGTSSAPTWSADAPSRNATLRASGRRTGIDQERGLARPLPEQVAQELHKSDPLAVHARDEVGQRPSIHARPAQAAIASATSFTICGLVPFLDMIGSVSGTARILPIVAVTIVRPVRGRSARCPRQRRRRLTTHPTDACGNRVSQAQWRRHTPPGRSRAGPPRRGTGPRSSPPRPLGRVRTRSPAVGGRVTMAQSQAPSGGRRSACWLCRKVPAQERSRCPRGERHVPGCGRGSAPTRIPGCDGLESVVIPSADASTEHEGDPPSSTRAHVLVSGLTAADVALRVAGGHTNVTDVRTSRSLADILRANLFTVFNGLLVGLFVVVMATGRWQNGLFGGVVVANAVIGIAQELRAKRTLDRLAVLNAPRARVRRDGVSQDVPVAEVVLDDIVEVRPGDQVPADAVVVESSGLEVDESVLTGEPEPVAKGVGDSARSGSVVVAGAGLLRATAVGSHSYAAELASQARRYTRIHSELTAGTARLLRWISGGIVLVAPVLVWSQFRSADNHGWQDATTGTVAALVGMVPEGLVLLTSLAFAVATIALARQSTLVQELPAVEVLARVDVVCLDKTGTLTDGHASFDRLEVLAGADEPSARTALGALSHTGDANATAAALSLHFPAPASPPVDAVPFSSARKWSAVLSTGQRWWVLGAPELVLRSPVDPAQVSARERADLLAEQGARVLVLAWGDADAVSADTVLPQGLQPQALVVLVERVREDAEATLRFFTDQGVALKVISGDNPRTVAAVASALGLLGVAGAADGVDGRTLPDDLDQLAAVMEAHSVFGRVTPQQKRAMVKALQRRGHVVAMTGDGVNDILALKDADIGVAMGSGTAATRAVAQVVLLDGRFAHLPDVVAQGRRVIANIERAANLFLVKNVYSLVLAVIVAFTGAAYPLSPVQLTLISAVTIGVPGFALALGPNLRRYRPGFLPRVLRFAVPAGVVTGVSAYLGYQATRVLDPASDLAGARTTATLIVLLVAWWTLLVLARPLHGWILALVAALAAMVVVVLAVPALGSAGLQLSVTPLRAALGAALGAAGALVVEVTHRSAAQLVDETTTPPGPQ
jgi:cation-transporting P-type ATPase E